MAIPIDDDDGRCVRNDGKRWRCSLRRSDGSRYCEKHHAYNLQKKSRVRVSTSFVVNKNKRRATEESLRASNSCSSNESENKKIEEIVDSRVSDASIEEVEEEEEVSRVVKLGEIWAFSKESDGIPQSYVRIDRIIPTPSLVEVSLLAPCLITDEEKLFAAQGLSLSCGLFRVSEESSFIKEISEFTHKVSFEIEGKESSLYKIFPKKGEVWALYFKWDDLERRFEYRLVEIETDFSEEEGLKVFGLVKVEGMDRVYQRQEYEGFHLIRSFSRGFMFMFSHQVIASRILQGDEVLFKLM